MESVVIQKLTLSAHDSHNSLANADYAVRVTSRRILHETSALTTYRALDFVQSTSVLMNTSQDFVFAEPSIEL